MPSINSVRATSHVVNGGLLWRRGRCVRTIPLTHVVECIEACTSSNAWTKRLSQLHTSWPTHQPPHPTCTCFKKNGICLRHTTECVHGTSLLCTVATRAGLAGHHTCAHAHPHTPCGCNFELALPKKSMAGHRLHKVRAPQVPCVPRAQRFHQGRDYIATANPPPSRQTTPSSRVPRCRNLDRVLNSAKRQKLQTL
jgi:hypothetical protein